MNLFETDFQNILFRDARAVAIDSRAHMRGLQKQMRATLSKVDRYVHDGRTTGALVVRLRIDATDDYPQVLHVKKNRTNRSSFYTSLRHSTLCRSKAACAKKCDNIHSDTLLSVQFKSANHAALTSSP